jgi:uncharacterized membrane protein YraQ (UPF0718 family)
MTPFRSLASKLFQRKTQKWILLGLALLVWLQVYYVQEMIAALIVFSVLFVAVCLVLLVIFLLDRASQHTVTWAKPGAARVAQAARRGVAIAEELTRKQNPEPTGEPRH